MVDRESAAARNAYFADLAGRGLAGHLFDTRFGPIEAIAANLIPAFGGEPLARDKGHAALGLRPAGLRPSVWPAKTVKNVGIVRGRVRRTACSYRVSEATVTILINYYIINHIRKGVPPWQSLVSTWT